jgi:hypothetical protein
LGKKFYDSLKTGPNFFLQHFKNKIIFNFVKFVAIKKGMSTKKNFRPSLLLRFLDLGSEIQNPGCGMGKKSGSGINIPDLQHWYNIYMFRKYGIGHMTCLRESRQEQ